MRSIKWPNRPFYASGHISVAHYFEQNGDLCQDPEMCFELVPHGAHVVYEPYLFQQAIPPIYQEVFATGAENVRLKRQLTSFAQQWEALIERSCHQVQTGPFVREQKPLDRAISYETSCPEFSSFDHPLSPREHVVSPWL